MKRHSATASRDGEPKIHPSAKLRNASLGRFCEIQERVLFQDSELGDYSYIERHAQAIYTVVGKFSAIAADVRLNALEHPMDRVSQHKMTYRPNEYFLGKPLDTAFREHRLSSKVLIGNDVWIGHGAIVLPGIAIGNGAVVGAGAVVTRDVAPYAVAAGVPARFRRWRFAPQLAERIEALAWWDWEHDRLAGAVDDMRLLTPERFVAKYTV